MAELWRGDGGMNRLWGILLDYSKVRTPGSLKDHFLI